MSYLIFNGRIAWSFLAAPIVQRIGDEAIFTTLNYSNYLSETFHSILNEISD